MGFTDRFALVFALIGGSYLLWALFLVPDQVFGPDDTLLGVDGAGTPEIGYWDDAAAIDAARQPAVFHFAPPSEADYDPTFLEYRQNLRAAVRSRATRRVLTMSHDDIGLSFGGDFGHETLRSWLDDPVVGSFYWQELEEILNLPAARAYGSGYCTPYIACAPLPPEVGIIDPFETAFVIVEAAPVYREPDEASQIVATYSYDAVLMGPYMDDPDWAEIVMPDGSAAYLRQSDFRMSVGYRALFDYIDGRWQMTMFLAGD